MVWVESERCCGDRVATEVRCFISSLPPRAKPQLQAVRRILYMATMTAICHNPPIRAFYRRLCAKGKPRKVALVAAMHKLLTVLNAVMQDQVPWTTASLSTAIHTCYGLDTF